MRTRLPNLITGLAVIVAAVLAEARVAIGVLLRQLASASDDSVTPS